MFTQADLSEEAFQRQILDLAGLTGWLVAHFHDSRRQVTRRGKVQFIGDATAAGFPDLVLVRAPRLIFAELKSKNGKLRASQTRWLEQLFAIRYVETYLWRPEDWDEVQETLVSRPTPTPLEAVPR